MYTARKTKTEIPFYLFGKIAAILLFMIALFLFVIFVLPERTASAGNTGGTYTIISVQIEEGDSLWSLASAYYSSEFSSITNYVAEIKRMNGLSSDTIYAGSYILIPQFLTE